MLCLSHSIRDDDPSVQRLVRAGEDAPARPALILAAWQVARVRAVSLGEAVLAERARRPTAWPPCPACGTSWRRQGCAPRQMRSLCGPIRGHRRVGRGPQGWGIPQGAPLDAALGGPPPQRPSEAVPSLGWALAVFAPFATAARFLGWSSGGTVRPRAGWGGVQAAGPRAMEQLPEQSQALAQGDRPPDEPLEAALAASPLVLGAAGVMVPWRPHGGQPAGQTRWHAVQVGVWARLGQQRTRTGQVVTRWPQRRLVAVLGRIDRLQPRVWLEAVRQGISHAPQVVWLREGARGGGGCLRSAWRPLPWASWTFPTPCSPGGRGPRPGWTAAPPTRAGGLAGHGTACGMASPMGSWQTWSRPGMSRASPTPHGTP